MSAKENFGVEMSRILPLLIREAMRDQENIFSKENMGVSNIVVFDLLRSKGACTMGEISIALGLTMSAATGIIDKMTDFAVVTRERDPEDRRVVKVELTKKGKKMSDQVAQSRIDMTNDLYSVLTDKERDEYLRLIKKVADNILRK